MIFEEKKKEEERRVEMRWKKKGKGREEEAQPKAGVWLSIGGRGLPTKAHKPEFNSGIYVVEEE